MKQKEFEASATLCVCVCSPSRKHMWPVECTEHGTDSRPGRVESHCEWSCATCGLRDVIHLHSHACCKQSANNSLLGFPAMVINLAPRKHGSFDCSSAIQHEFSSEEHEQQFTRSENPPNSLACSLADCKIFPSLAKFLPPGKTDGREKRPITAGKSFAFNFAGLGGG